MEVKEMILSLEEKDFRLTIDKKLLLDDGRFLNLTTHDPQSWPTVLEM